VTENRKHPRKLIASEVAYQVGAGERIEARCRDLSLGGMFIETPAPPPYGTAVRVFMQLPGLQTETAVDAIVRWWKPTGMGVQFGVMGARETHGLTELLAKHPAPRAVAGQ
jgi:type IV pilus assembly protein PilZ